MTVAVRFAKRVLAPLAIAGIASILAGCTTFSSNVSSDFSCTAPDGTCAPSSTIDDAAIASIQDASSNAEAVPAGPYQVDDGDVPGIRLASAEAPARDTRPAPRTHARVLRVVFPAYVDRYGQLHEKSAVQAEVDVEAVPQLAAHDERSDDEHAAPGAGLFGAAESAPQMLALATPPAPEIDVPVPLTGLTSNVTVASPNTPQPAVPTPIASIKDQVAQKLADSAKLKAADFPGKVD